MRDLIVFLIIFGSIPFILKRPYIGVLVSVWISIMAPHKLGWGAAYNFPFAYIITLVTILALSFQWLSNKEQLSIKWERETIILCLLWGMFLISTVFALNPSYSWPAFIQITKILISAFLIILLIDNKSKMRLLALTVAGSLGFYAVKSGIFSILSDSKSRIWGPEGTAIADNNEFGLAMNMCIPFLLFLAFSEKNKIIKTILFIAVPCAVLAVIFTYSRGAFLGLIVVTALILMTVSTKYKIIAVGLIVVVLSSATAMIPQRWFDRIGTLNSYEEDGSAMSRFAAWETAWNVAKDNPLTGGGFNVVDDPTNWIIYNPYATDNILVHQSGVHSIYFEVLAENGFIGFSLFVMLLFSSVLSMRRLRSLCKQKNLELYVYYSQIFEISLMAYAVSGVFLEVVSFDLFYIIVALVIVLKNLAYNELNSIDNGEIKNGEEMNVAGQVGSNRNI